MPPATAEARRHAAGFTLIEVMITVAIVAILASIALPSYTAYIRRGQLQEGFATLSDYRVKMEQYYQDNRNYGATTGTACATDSTAGSWNAFTATKYFSFACATTNNGQNFVVTATGRSSLTAGYVYTINDGGTRATTRYAGNTVTAACWLLSSTVC